MSPWLSMVKSVERFGEGLQCLLRVQLIPGEKVVNSYQQVRVQKSTAADLEQLGTKRKFWYRDDEGKRLLFKA